MMRPFLNSFPHQQQQQQQQQGNNMLMMQHQMGIFNPQLPIPSSNNNGSANVMPLMNNVGFMNGDNHLGGPQFGPMFPNLNNVSMFQQQLHGQFGGPLQNPNLPNWLNLPQQVNQSNIALTNGQQQQQLFLQNQLQQMGQLLNMQIPNLSQFVSAVQTVGCLNPTAVPNPQFGFMLQASHSQQNIGDISASNPSCSAAASQGVGDPPFGRPMGDPGKNGQNSSKFQRRNVARDSKWGFQKSKFQQSRFHPADNPNRKFAYSNGHKKKGQDNRTAAKLPHSDTANPDKEKRRSLALMYTEQEIRQWREDRKKHYPTKANIKKKLSGKVAESEIAKSRSEQLKEILAKQAELGVEVAEIPSHYLLGSEKKVNRREEGSRPSTKRGRFEMKHDNKRGRFDNRGRFSRKRRSTNEEPCEGPSTNKRNPTLLQKLLGADIKKDKSRLLQVFRFMVMNSFFKDWPDKPLKFPVVVVRDGLCQSEIVQENALLVGKDGVEVCNKTMIESIGGDDINHNNKDGNASGNHDNHSDEHVDIGNDENNDANCDGDDYVSNDTQVDQVVRGKADSGEEIVRNEEEEGEIID